MARISIHPARCLGLLALALIAWFAFAEWDQRSPGALSAVHSREAELADPQGCALCHGDAQRDLSQACSACHAAIAQQGETRTGLHGALDPQLLKNCGACHSEHRGSDLVLAGAHAFAVAGIPDLKRYDHRHTEFALHGAHEALACAACHKQAQVDVLAAGEQRFLGLVQDCASCHRDPHAGTLPGCESCHGQERPFAEVANFVHDERFALEGAHAGVACTACHAPGTERGLNELLRSNAPSPLRQCADCHPHEHSAPYLAAVAAELKLPDLDASCATCHAIRAGGFVAVDPVPVRRTHAASGFALTAPHAALACTACHAAAEDKASFATRYPGRKAEDCASCHGDPHGGQFAVGAFAGARCTDCHAPSHFAPSRIDATQHAQTAFALEGRHRQLACTECHPSNAAEPIAARVFSAAPSACAECHRDPHRGQFAGNDNAQGCEHCHDAQAFAPSLFDAVAHAATPFALHGAHRSVACAECHPSQDESSPAGDRRFRGTNHACAACHIDPHAGQFAARPGEQTDCSRCHDSTSFHRSAFTEAEHAQSGFALTGSHRAVSCDRCHIEVETLGGMQRRFRGTSHTCADCHADPHLGRFDAAALPTVVANREGCARCHNTNSFQDVERAAFDHAAWTGYRLLGAHARATCEQCHIPSSDPTATRRLSVANTACSDCHSDPHAGQFVVDGVNDCARCHVSSAKQFELRTNFDHDRDTRFALDSAHQKLACSACHIPQRTERRAAVVRYRPLGLRCEDCHGTAKRDGGGGR